MRGNKRELLLCLKNSGYEGSLERRKIYHAIPGRRAALDHLVRVIDESGEDYLYPASVRKPSASDDEMLPEYDFRGGVPGKYAARYAEGTNVVVLDPDVAATFPNAPAA